MAFFVQYPYLAGSLCLLGLFAAGFLIFKDQRKPMLLSGALSAPFAFASVMFVPDYWNPVRIVEFGAGIEDLVFSFSTGGIAWLLAVWPFRSKVAVHLDPRRIARGYVTVCLAGTATTALSWRLGLSPMGATLVGVFSVGLALLLVRTERLPIFLSGMVGFAVLYGIWIAVLALIWPHFLTHWSHENLMGIHVGVGIPLEELIWAMGFGGVWPLFMSFVFGCKGRQQTPLKPAGSPRLD
jgi:hypothetical protein